MLCQRSIGGCRCIARRRGADYAGRMVMVPGNHFGTKIARLGRSARLRPVTMSGRPARIASARAAFTLIELMVVMVIIVVLISALMVSSTALINRSRVSNTRAVFSLVQNAIDEFKREQQTRATLTKSPSYTKRYGLYPPDELEGFTNLGVPNAASGKVVKLAPRGAQILPAPPYTPMKFHTQGLSLPEQAMEHRDIAALVLAIELYGDASKMILDGIPARNWKEGPVDSSGDPVAYLDRDGSNDWTPQQDIRLRYIVDAWRNPISYMTQRDWKKSGTGTTASNNLPQWNEASTEIVRLNGGQPVLISYGPDGAEQLKKDVMGSAADASVAVDFDESDPKPHGVVDHEFNTDNVYGHESLKTKLTKGLP